MREPWPACRRRAGRKHPHQEFYQLDTTNILFICGGAFDGLDKIIGSRIGQKSIGFNSEIADKQDENVGELFKQVLPEDFVKFGLITGVDRTSSGKRRSGSSGRGGSGSAFCPAEKCDHQAVQKAV